jgi:hypothetical protein
MAKRRLKTLDDCRRYLADCINRLEDGQLDPSVAGKIGYLVNVLRGIIEGSDIEERLSRLEARIGGGK